MVRIIVWILRLVALSLPISKILTVETTSSLQEDWDSKPDLEVRIHLPGTNNGSQISQDQYKTHKAYPWL
jgi:hypothetical protein